MLFWIIVIPFLILLAGVTIFDIVRHHYGGWPTAAWILLVVFLPLIGSIVYWVARKPVESPEDLERAYRAEADLRRTAQR